MIQKSGTVCYRIVGKAAFAINHQPAVKKLDGRQTGGPLKNLDCPSDDVNHDKSTEVIAKNVATMVITNAGTAALPNDNSVDRAPWYNQTTNIWDSLLSDLHAFDIEYKARPHEVGFHILSSQYCARVSISIQGYTLRTVTSLLDADASLDLINRSFFPPFWNDHIKPADSAPSRTETRPAAQIEGIIPMFVRFVDPCTLTWL